MRPITEAARSTLVRPHRRAARVSILDADLHPIEGAVLTGEEGYAIAGSVVMDLGRDVRRTCDVTLVNPGGVWTPREPGDLFYWDRLVKLERGVYTSPSQIEWASLGVFVIDQPQVNVTDSGGIDLRITGIDRMDRVLRSKFTAPDFYAAGARLQVALADLALDAGIGSGFHRLDDGGKTLAANREFEVGEERIALMRDLALDYSLDVYADADGVFVVEPWRDPMTVATAWEFTAGRDAVMTGLSKTWSKDRLYNHVLVTGESAEGVIVRAEASDTNPASPTRTTGPLGDRLYTYTSAMIRTTGQAQEVANRLLVDHALIEEEIRLPFAPIPFLEVGDVVRIIEPASNTDDRYQIHRLTMPLGAGAATLDVRKLRSLLL